MSESLKLATRYHDLGWETVPNRPNSEVPISVTWQSDVVQSSELADQFQGRDVNVGVALGGRSGGIVMVDSVSKEARQVDYQFLPTTELVFGTKSSEISRYVYEARADTRHYWDPLGQQVDGLLVSLLSDGAQACFPPSRIASSGEYRWAYGDVSRPSPCPSIQSDIGQIAVAALLLRYRKGAALNECRESMVHFLLGCGLSDVDGARILFVIEDKDQHSVDRNHCVGLFKRVREENDSLERNTAYETLAEVFGSTVLDTVVSWLGGEQPSTDNPILPRLPSSITSEQVTDLGSDVAIARDVKAELERIHRDVVACNGHLYVYRNTHWEKLDASATRMLVINRDGLPTNSSDRAGVVKLSRSRIDSVIDVTHTLLQQEEFFSKQLVGLNCLNGFLKFDERGCNETLPHCPDHRVGHVIPGSYHGPVSDDVLNHSLTMKFLRGCFRDDEDQAEKIMLIEELGAVAAMGFATRLGQPKACVLYGASANNGKSEMIELLRCLLPDGVLSSVPLDSFGDEKNLVRLYGSLLNTADELGSTKQVSSARTKQIITGERTMARNLYQSAFDFEPRALHVFATNILPGFQGGFDAGIRRRFTGIEFSRVIPDHERIPNIVCKIRETEMDVWLSMVVSGAIRIIRTGKFTEPKSSAEVMRNWFLSSDPVPAWMEACIRIVPGSDFVSTRDAYQSFKDWSQDEGFSPRQIPEINIFAQRVLAASPIVTKSRTGSSRGFKGLVLPVVLDFP